jgi:hypothetical protein
MFFPQLIMVLRSKLHADIDTWLEGTDLLPLPISGALGAKPAAAPNRQGEVTSKTPTKPATTKASAK